MNALNIVQMKRNGSNCPTGRNLDKISSKMREESHFMHDSKQKCGNFTVIAGNLEGLIFMPTNINSIVVTL
jgi:hypothetical protein